MANNWNIGFTNNYQEALECKSNPGKCLIYTPEIMNYECHVDPYSVVPAFREWALKQSCYSEKQIKFGCSLMTPLLVNMDYQPNFKRQLLYQKHFMALYLYDDNMEDLTDSKYPKSFVMDYSRNARELFCNREPLHDLNKYYKDFPKKTELSYKIYDMIKNVVAECHQNLPRLVLQSQYDVLEWTLTGLYNEAQRWREMPAKGEKAQWCSRREYMDIKVPSGGFHAIAVNLLEDEDIQHLPINNPLMAQLALLCVWDNAIFSWPKEMELNDPHNPIFKFTDKYGLSYKDSVQLMANIRNEAIYSVEVNYRHLTAQQQKSTLKAIQQAIGLDHYYATNPRFGWTLNEGCENKMFHPTPTNN